MTVLNDLVQKINGYLSDYILVFLLVGGGIWFTFLLRGIQFRGLGTGLKMTFGGLFSKKSEAGKDGMSSFQALATAVAAQVGTGNIAGAATAIYIGGPGAIFWMWVAACLGMATIFAEASLAQKYKVVGKDGEVTGGPVYYILEAFSGELGKTMAALFSVFIIIALGFVGNAVQSNSIAAAFKEAFNIPTYVMGIVIAVLAFVVFMGGTKRIVQVTELIVPFMAALYILGSLVIVIMRIGHVPAMFANIFMGAFNPEAMIGGAFGATVKLAVTKGVARGLFSNEAGMGSTPHAHACAKVDHPAQQGFVAMAGVFIDTFVVLNLTAFVILSTTTRETMTSQGLTGAALSQAAYTSVYGNFGKIFIAICMFFFAFSTIVGWYFFGKANINYLFGPKAIPVYSIIVAACVFLGSLGEVGLVWNMADLFNSLMVIPNFLALFALSKVVKQLHDEYYYKFKK